MVVVAALHPSRCRLAATPQSRSHTPPACSTAALAPSSPGLTLPPACPWPLQGRLLAALLFFALHFMGYYIGDTAILEVSQRRSRRGVHQTPLHHDRGTR